MKVSRIRLGKKTLHILSDSKTLSCQNKAAVEKANAILACISFSTLFLAQTGKWKALISFYKAQPNLNLKFWVQCCVDELLLHKMCKRGIKIITVIKYLLLTWLDYLSQKLRSDKIPLYSNTWERLTSEGMFRDTFFRENEHLRSKSPESI